MSDDQQRGRRCPPSGEHSRKRYTPVEEEPRSKVFKQGSRSPEARTQKPLSLEPSTSTRAVVKPEKQLAQARDSVVKSESQDERNRRTRYDIVRTRPADAKTKMGSSGQPINLKANYFRILTTPNWRLFQYHVSFSPEIELKHVRAGILSEFRSNFGGYLYDGAQLFTTTKLEEKITTLKAKSKTDALYEITIKHVGVVSMTEWQSLQILNLILRRAMEGLKLQYVGRNFFDPVAKIDLRDFRLQLWPGYQTSIRQHERDILLCAEIAHKVMRTETLYDILQRCTQSRDYQEDFRRQVLGLTILTDYNNQTYRINDIDFESNPRKTFSMKGKDVSFVDYYYQKYNIRIRDPNQPLLISKCKDRPARGQSNDIVVLIPELCRATGLTDTMRTNFQLMRALADHTRMNPDRRIERLCAFNRRLQQTESSIKILNEWNMKLDKYLLEVPGRKLEPQKIVFSDKKKVTGGEQADWGRVFRDIGMFTTPSRGLQRWAVIGTNRSSRDLRSFIDALIRAAGGLSMQITRPREVMLYDDRTHSYIQALEDVSRDDPQLILCLVPNNNAERYASIKKKACIERCIPTQVITQKVASNQRGLMSVATKVAIQINCKLGYTPWMIELPLSGLMTIGYDVAKSTRDRARSYGALVATMNLKENATFYSTVTECSSADILANNLWPMMTKALRQYRKEHGSLPTRIIFYRDGVGEGSLSQVYEHEVKDIVEKLSQEYKRAEASAPPMFGYIIVTKATNTRFFLRESNPPPGTVVDDIVTLPERYDFYLVSQSVRQGTVSPTAYNVVYSDLRLTPDQIQMLSYKMTHLYYNWSGTTRVPAVCQYAKKLATLVSTSLHNLPQNALEKKLFYL